jgi:C4-dicarboxylate-specific signal transduction histidine kinase
MEWLALAGSILTALLSFAGVYVSNRKQTALMEYRLKELEKKVDKHNQVVERTFKLEGQMTELQHEIQDLKH